METFTKEQVLNLIKYCQEETEGHLKKMVKSIPGLNMDLIWLKPEKILNDWKQKKGK